MALSILPSDGFITRLLQQTHHATPAKPAASNQAAEQKPDQMTFSNEARQATNQPTSNSRLESKLMELYNQKGEGSA